MSGKEIYDQIRSLVRRVVVRSVDDGGEMQKATVEVADGILREGVEVWQPFGLLGNPPADGAIGLALSIGGDEGDMVLLPLGNPSARVGGAPEGAVGIANAFGDRVLVLPGGGIEVKAASSISLAVGGCSLTIDADGFHFSGGGIWHDGVPTDKTHTHGGVISGGDHTAPPDP
ncbi:Mu-like prophage protein gp45 [Rhizobium sp. RU35A]|uniref:phage baseplate assembly protein domain-containing protein n=1 Tax=Rhizobium sp. RU35A TaxID=1907414 RepID=UPI000954BC2C|nr:phage baseplate assembly protein [Rhizobium sp. RU35A]SIQ23743.1 Mu-like prophage protein gp45 [Rhizobium sp. RU35A]